MRRNFLITAVLSLFFLNLPAVAQTRLAPAPSTGSATNISSSGATLNGSVNPNGVSTNYYFEYGLSTSYGQSTPLTSIGSGFSAVQVQASVSGLAASATYHFRVVGRSRRGIRYGSDASFQTTASSLVPAFTYSPSYPVTGSPVSFDGTMTTCSASPCSYQWTDDVDNSLLGTGAKMSMTFQQAGTKSVRLTVTDAQPSTMSVMHDVIVATS
jgi:PKD domain-containing protein